MLATMIEEFRNGREVNDYQFDRIYPTDIRAWTRPHWTPVEVALRAAELLVVDAGTKVLDVGSGAGKLCLIGALTTSATFCGVEQRAYLARVTQALASSYQISRVSFVHGKMTSVNWSDFNAFYFFNPFYENIAPQIRIDNAVNFSRARYERCIRIVQKKLTHAPRGTRVVTYHGLGGEMPLGYVLVHREFCFSGPLELWVKA